MKNASKVKTGTALNSDQPDSAITSVMTETRSFTPEKAFSDTARIGSMKEYRRLVKRAADDPERFWGSIAEELHWFKPWKKLLQWRAPFAKWFVGGKTNMSYNCLDRHLGTWRRTKAAIIWEGEPGEIRTLTYAQLHREVARFANVLRSLGVGKGDTVAIYMGMVPEAAIAMLS